MTVDIVEQFDTLQATIAELEQRATELRTVVNDQSNPLDADFAKISRKRGDAREMLLAVDNELRRLRNQRNAAQIAVEGEQMRRDQKESRLIQAERTLTDVPARFVEARRQFADGAEHHVIRRDAIGDLVWEVERARVQLRAAGRDVPERITIEL